MTGATHFILQWKSHRTGFVFQTKLRPIKELDEMLNGKELGTAVAVWKIKSR